MEVSAALKRMLLNGTGVKAEVSNKNNHSIAYNTHFYTFTGL